MFLDLLALSGSSSVSSNSNIWSSVLVFISFLAITYFFLIRPQKQKMDEHQSLLDSIKIGDKVVTLGGLIGNISKINTDSFEIELSSNNRVYVAKYAVSEKYKGTSVIAMNSTNQKTLKTSQNTKK